MSKKKEKSGFFISFEGSEGSGKTTQINRLSIHLEDTDHETIITREPGGTEIGETIRHLLKHDSSGDDMFPETELLLFAASRAQLVREVIKPALEENISVVCDRFLDSSTVYQGAARKIASDPIQIINQFAVGDLMPDLTIVLDVPVTEGLERIKHRYSDLPDRMEEENVNFYELVREGYLYLAETMPERFVVLDGTQSKKNIEGKIWQIVQDRFLLD